MLPEDYPEYWMYCELVLETVWMSIPGPYRFGEYWVDWVLGYRTELADWAAALRGLYEATKYHWTKCEAARGAEREGKMNSAVDGRMR